MATTARSQKELFTQCVSRLKSHRKRLNTKCREKEKRKLFLYRVYVVVFITILCVFVLLFWMSSCVLLLRPKHFNFSWTHTFFFAIESNDKKDALFPFWLILGSANATHLSFSIWSFCRAALAWLCRTPEAVNKIRTKATIKHIYFHTHMCVHFGTALTLAFVVCW